MQIRYHVDLTQDISLSLSLSLLTNVTYYCFKRDHRSAGILTLSLNPFSITNGDLSRHYYINNIIINYYPICIVPVTLITLRT